MITFNGKTATAKEWAAITGIPRGTIENRLGRQGWTIERTLTTPSDKNYDGSKAISKNSAEMMLNDMTYDELPKAIQRIIKACGTKAKKYGQASRKADVKAFNKWFDEEYSKTTPPETDTKPPLCPISTNDQKKLEQRNRLILSKIARKSQSL